MLFEWNENGFNCNYEVSLICVDKNRPSTQPDKKYYYHFEKGKEKFDHIVNSQFELSYFYIIKDKNTEYYDDVAGWIDSLYMQLKYGDNWVDVLWGKDKKKK